MPLPACRPAQHLLRGQTVEAEGLRRRPDGPFRYVEPGELGPYRICHIPHAAAPQQFERDEERGDEHRREYQLVHQNLGAGMRH